MSDTCCGCTNLSSNDDYNVGLHIGAIFILFVVSSAGVMLPIVSKYVPALAVNSMIMEVLMTFGFGVVIATGLIHMMNDGVETLSDPCLGNIVNEYGSLGMAVVLATIVIMHLIECESSVFFSKKNPGGYGHGHGHVHGNAPIVSASTPHDEERSSTAYHDNGKLFEEGHQATTTLTRETANSNKAKLATILFEVGVLFHSVIIGIDLGVTAGTEFKTLLGAICFHQFFEGIAIGGSAVGSIESFKSVVMMGVAFAITTPIGLFIGILIRSSYSSTSVTALWVEGVLNCVAAGILVYTGLVELLTYHMTINEKFLKRSGPQRFTLYAACWLGAGLMALIGKWA